MGYSVLVCKELHRTEQLTLSFFHFMAYYRILNIVSGAIQ